MDIFENINIANLSFNRYRDYFGGVKCKLYYAPADYFLYTPLPSESESFSSIIEVTEQIVMKPDKLMSYTDVLIDEGELKALYQGSARRKKGISSLNVFLLGFTTETLGFAERMINIPMIFFIEDANGNRWQIGHKRNRASIESFEANTGKKYEDNPGASMTLGCNSQILKYNFSLNLLSKKGDFNNDFNDDFFI